MIPISMNEGERIYILFSAQLGMYDDSSVYFKVYIDGTFSFPGQIYLFNEAGGGDVQIPVVLQYEVMDLSEGAHNISIYAQYSSGTTWITYPSLYVQSYI